MPQSKKKGTEVKTLQDVSPEVIYYMNLVYKVRESNDRDEVNEAFRLIAEGLEVKIKKIAGKFKIPGFSFDDVYQECLVALQTKAIKDYDETRGSEPGKPAPFDRFALLCIRRHLATTLKTSHQNKIRILNESKSLDQDRSNDNDELSLINIVCGTDSDVLNEIQKKENYRVLMSKLLSRLSPFERQVFRLYAQQFTYEEIARHINRDEGLSYRNRVNIKGVDNALSRIKNKAKVIRDRMLSREEKDYRHKQVDNALQRIKKKARAIAPKKKTSRRRSRY